MKYTWGEIQIETCKKMFLNNDNISVEQIDILKGDNKYKVYFNGMPHAANEGIAELLKRGKPYIKTFSFTKKISDNLLQTNFNKYEHITDDVVFEADKGLSYYFEVDNKAIIEIYINDEIAKTIDTESSELGSFKAYKGFLNNPNGDNVRIVFKGNNPYLIRNVCIYELNYDYDNDGNINYIPNYTNEAIFDLRTLVPDFYKINKFYYQGNLLVNNTDYQMTDTYTLVLSDFKDGNYIIKYQCYPEKLDTETPAEYELPLEPECAVILPLYMASQLYKDDDITLSTIYRNEFETAIENLYPVNNDLKFINKNGWL